MKIINLFGGPAVGKSTTAAGLFFEMKRRGMNVELVTEYAKDLVWERRHNILKDQQEYIFAKQNRRLHRLRDRVDYVITDSPLLLGLVYVNEDWAAVNEFKTFVKAVVETYDNMNFFLIRDELPEHGYQQEGRIHDLDEASTIDHQILEVLQNNAIYQNVNVSPVTVAQILQKIIEKEDSRTKQE